MNDQELAIIIPLAVHFLASIVSALWPNALPSTWQWYIQKVVNALALNVGNAKNGGQ